MERHVPPTSIRYFAIADIHGCYDELMLMYEKLEKEAKLKPSKDTLIFLGDYVDRGPKTKQVVQQMIDWEKKYPHWVFLKGNHEDLMLDALLFHGKRYQSYDLWYRQGGLETAQSYFPPDFSKYDMAISQPEDYIKAVHLGWLSETRMYFETDDYFFVHAGVVPEMSLEEIKQESDEDPVRGAMLWARDEFIESDYDWGKKIIFGHTADGLCKYNKERFMPIIYDNKIGIDCAVCSADKKGKLCALELPSEKLYFINAI